MEHHILRKAAGGRVIPRFEFSSSLLFDAFKHWIFECNISRSMISFLLEMDRCGMIFPYWVRIYNLGVDSISVSACLYTIVNGNHLDLISDSGDLLSGNFIMCHDYLIDRITYTGSEGVIFGRWESSVSTKATRPNNSSLVVSTKYVTGGTEEDPYFEPVDDFQFQLTQIVPRDSDFISDHDIYGGFGEEYNGTFVRTYRRGCLQLVGEVAMVDTNQTEVFATIDERLVWVEEFRDELYSCYTEVDLDIILAEANISFASVTVATADGFLRFASPDLRDASHFSSEIHIGKTEQDMLCELGCLSDMYEQEQTIVYNFLSQLKAIYATTERLELVGGSFET
jgi:hypothetical protein